MKHLLGIIGLVFGFAALAIAVFQHDLRPPPEPRPKPTLKEVAAEATKHLIQEKILKEKSGESARLGERRHDAIEITFMGLGLVAIILGTISWVRKEHIRLSSGAIALGVIAVAWEVVLLGILLGVAVVVIGYFSS
ncbi:MAG: hypothetical protein R3F11_32380 [Verrucomicrobiales bacterium]